MRIDTEDMPKWDVALEALLSEQQERRGAPLHLEALREIAREYGIRFDDIVDTLFIMCAEQRWEYHDAKGMIKPITRAEIEALFAHGRLRDEDMQQYDGLWQPAN